MNCNQCGTQLPFMSSVCSTCGLDAKTGKRAAAVAGATEVASGCPRCHAALAPSARFCTSCGYDLQHEAEIDILVGPQLRKARTWILVVGILYAVFGTMMFFVYRRELPSDFLVKTLLIPNLALFVIHLGLWWWARRAPFAASVVALALFIVVQVVNLALDPSSIKNGIILKVFFIAALVSAVKAGLEANRLRHAQPSR